MVSTRLEACSQIIRRARFNCASVRSVSLGKEPTPGSKTLVVRKGMIPFRVLRTDADPWGSAEGVMPLMTVDSRLRSSSRSRSCFW